MEKELRIWLIVLTSLFVTTILIALIILIKNHRFQKNFSQGKINLNSSVYVDEKTFEKKVKLIIANRTINPIIINSFGLMYNNQKIELIDKLKKQENAKFISCKSRDSLSLDYDYLTLYKLLDRDKKLKNVYIFTIDSLGFDSKAKFKHLKKIVKLDRKREKNGEDIRFNFDMNDDLDDTNNEASYEEESTNNDSFSNLENQPFDLYRDDGVDESDETNIDENANDDNNIF